MDELIKELINKYKPNVKRDRLFSGYDINVYDSDHIKKETHDYLDKHFMRPDIKSNEYHDYYKKMLIVREIADAFYAYFENLRYRLPVPEGTEVYVPQRD